MTAVHGTCDPRFTGVRDLLVRRLADGDEAGASLCVVEDGEVTVDLWGGVADVESGRPWTRDTIVNTFSLTKTMTALAALALIDHGLLDPDAPVADYWPEFASAGKGSVLVRHVLGHTSGVSGWERPVTLEDLYDTRAAAALLAAQPPWWTPGDGSGYQAMSHGHIVGELVHRITGERLGAFFDHEFAAPSGADFFIGTPESEHHRVAALVPPPPSGIDYSALPADSVFVRTMTNPRISPAVTTDPGYLSAELGAANGQGNARSVARLQSIVSNGGVLDGRRYLSPAVIEKIFDVQADGRDRVLGAHLRFGLGYTLPSPAVPSIPDGRVCWWTGFGGSVVVNDLDRGVTVAYVMNKMDAQLVGAPNATAYLDAVFAALDDETAEAV
ncbi:serine hydrolase domain-containing protein [Prescottella subtropica]|uniref:serine hydrolase domain-containing protein n=1 Tax=Prescottella subtropica TaxID=2545757 RepID=UPI0010F5D7AF|nr:serine hydrolase domain-containing protein [Prescottella subtropica]